MRTISFSVSDQEHGMFCDEAACKGMAVSAYCKMAAFSHLAKYASKGAVAEKIKLLRKQGKVAPDPTFVDSQGNPVGGL